MNTEAMIWLAQAIRLGYAYQRDERIELRGEYLETLGYARAADVLMLDFNREAEWIACTNVRAAEDHLVFDIGADIRFVIPLEPDIIRGAKFLTVTNQGVPASPPVPIQPFNNPEPLAAWHAYFEPASLVLASGAVR